MERERERERGAHTSICFLSLQIAPTHIGTVSTVLLKYHLAEHNIGPDFVVGRSLLTPKTHCSVGKYRRSTLADGIERQIVGMQDPLDSPLRSISISLADTVSPRW